MISLLKIEFIYCSPGPEVSMEWRNIAMLMKSHHEKGDILLFLHFTNTPYPQKQTCKLLGQTLFWISKKIECPLIWEKYKLTDRHCGFFE